jgi:zinc D-Ala-D-Ala carboxypeptidase
MIKYHHILFPPLALILLALLSFSCNNPTAREPLNPVTREPGNLATGDHKGRPYKEPNIIRNSQLATPNPQLPMTPSKDQLLGRIDPAASADFVLIGNRYASREGMYMHKEVYKAFLEMHAAAASDGISLTIISAMRTFNHQKRIWENKWRGRQVLHGNIRATDFADPVERALEILRFSAMPGTSRHHWGTDIDINNLNNSYFASGKGKREYDWLVANAGKFGFCQPYTAHGTNREGGYEEEKWHWSYMPVSAQYLRTYIDAISYDDIKGFDGWETAAQIDVIGGYVKEVGCGE